MHFKAAFITWLDTHPEISLRTLAQTSGVDTSMLSLIRKGTQEVTFKAITKLLPSIERHSSRAAAVTLLIAYLSDETPPSHQDSIRIEPIDLTGQPTADAYRALADRWERKARIEPDFMAMWQGMDAYMHTPENILYARPGSDIALLAEPMPEYKTTPRPGHPHDTIRHDAMPSQHAAQEHHEP